MNRWTLAMLPLAALLIGAAPQKPNKPAKPPSASARLFTTSGQEVGKATIFQRGSILHLVMYVQRQDSGFRALHIHTTGFCTPPDFASAGAHWNPGGKQHGRDNPMGPHAGDISNIRVEPDGVGKIHTDVGPGSLFTGPARLMDKDGAAIVVHELADDFKTDPSGASGKRLVCGVFKRD